MAALLAVQGNDHPTGTGTALLNQAHYFTDRGACGDHVINDQNIARQRRAHNVAAFAVGFGFFAIEGVRHIQVVVVGQRRRGDRRQRNAFVGRAKQHVGFQATIYNGLGVKAA